MDPLLRAIGFLHEKSIQQRRIRALASVIAPLLPKSARVLDVGCGDGWLARTVLDTRPDLRIQGVEVMVRPFPPIRVDKFNGTQLPFADGEVDVAMAIDVFHHAADPTALLDEMKRVTRGVILIKDHLLHGLPSALILKGMDWVGNFRYGVRLPYSYRSEAEWREAWDRSGVRPVSIVRHLNVYPFPLSLVCDRDLHFLAILEPTRHTPGAA